MRRTYVLTESSEQDARLLARQKAAKELNMPAETLRIVRAAAITDRERLVGFLVTVAAVAYGVSQGLV
jgi:hypothetical protein